MRTRGLLIAGLLMVANVVWGQSDAHRRVADQMVAQFNIGDFEGIYQSFSDRMKKAHSHQYYLDFLDQLKSERGSLIKLELLDFREDKKQNSRGFYSGYFDNEVLDVWISTNNEQQIIGLYFKERKPS